FPVEREPASDRRRVSTEATHPEPVTENHHARLPFRHGLRLAECPARRERYAQEFEEVRCDDDAAQGLWRAFAAVDHAHAAITCDRLEDLAVPQVAIVQIGELVAVAGLYRNDALRPGDRGLVPENPFDRREQREVDT